LAALRKQLNYWTILTMNYKENSDTGEFDILYDNIIKNKDCLSITRILAADLQANPYYTVGQFLKNLNDVDLAELNDIVNCNFKHDLDEADEEEEPETDPRMADIVLLAEMLSRGEDVVSKSDEELLAKINQFMIFISIESLRRKGLVEAYHSNMTFGNDSEERVIVKRLHDLDE
jgi:hypothetical protein